MADPFDLESDRQRRAVLGALALYVALFVVELTTGNTVAAAAADLLLATLVIAGSAFGLSRATGSGETDARVVATVVAFFVAGVTIAYEGLATLGALPQSDIVQGVGNVALLAGLLLYFFALR